MQYICPLCAEGWILRNRVPLSETKSMSYDLTQPQQPRALDFRHQTLHSSSRWQQHTTIISWHTRGVLTTMTSLQKVFSLIPKCYAWFWFRNNTHLHDYHKSHNHKKRGRTWEKSNSTQFDSFRSVLGCLGTLPKNHSEPPGFFCMQTRSSEALVLKNCVCWISIPLCGCVFFSKTPSGFTEPAADHTSISRNLEMVVANTLWSWRTSETWSWSLTKITHSCEGFHSLSAYCFIFQGTSGFLKFIQCRDAPMSWPPFSGTARHSLKLRCAGKSTPCSLICLSAICVNV